MSAWLSELELPGSILGDSNVCFDFHLICVAFISFKYRSVKQSTDRGRGVKCAPRATNLQLLHYCPVLPLLKKVALPLSSPLSDFYNN